MAEELSIEQRQALALAAARVRAQPQPEKKATAAEYASANPVVANPSLGDKFRMAFGGATPQEKEYSKLQQQEAIEKMHSAGWGSGADKAAYELGAKVSDIAGPTAGYVANVGASVIPAIFGGQAASALTPAMTKVAQALMGSAVKPTLAAHESGKAARGIQTMLDEGINVTQGGVDKARGLIDAINQRISGAIAGSGATVSKGSAASRAQDVVRRVEDQVAPAADMKAVEDVITSFMNHPNLAGRDEIAVELAQRLKQGTYSALKKDYGKKGSAEIEAQKAIARGLKEEIANAVPAVGPLNARESALIDALSISQRRAMMGGNNNPFGLSLLADNPAAALAFMADRSAALKSMLARAMYSGREVVPRTIGATTGAAVGQGQPEY